MYHRVVAQVCKKYGKEYTKEMQGRMLGGTDRYVSEHVVKELKIDVSVDAFEADLLNLSEQLLPKAPLQEGVERLLMHLKDNKVPIALATNSTSSQVEMHAKAKPHIFKVFNHVVTATDPSISRGKPFPDLYLAAAERFPARPHPSECLVFEDSKVGLQAGISAGMQVVLTPHQDISPEVARQATLVLHNLLDFDPLLFGLPPFQDDKPCIRRCPPPQAFKPPLSARDPCSHCRPNPCCGFDNNLTECKKPFSMKSITENETFLATLLFGIIFGIVYRLW